MALFQSSVVRNRLLSALRPDDFALLGPKLERVPLVFDTMLIGAFQPIEHVYFLESGIVSAITHTEEGRIEVGMIGREGMVGVPAILGVDQSPHSFLIQGGGEALRIATQDLRAAIAERPSIFRPLGLFTHTLMFQIGQTAYANVVHNTEVRLARWILLTQDRLDTEELPLTHEFLSAMLGVRRPGVTSATHTLEASGSIRNKRGRIQVLRRDNLLELTGDAYQAGVDEYERVMGPDQG